MKELFSILIKYDLVTIDNCMDYIMANKDQLTACIDFLNGNNAVMRKGKSKNAIDEFLFTIDREKAVIIKRTCRYLAGKNFSAEQMCDVCRQYFETKQLSTNFISSDKDGLSLEIAQILANLSLEDITEFERNVQMSKSTGGQNTLENWSKVIIKE